MSVADEIEKLDNLRQKGAISEEEYQKAKSSLLGKHESIGEKFNTLTDSISSDESTWSMLIHFSQFCGFILPLAGMVIPIVLWQLKKNESLIIDKHGRIVANWIITEVIFAAVFFILSFIIIGIPLLIALLILGIIFPIIGGIKAKDGEVWKYPCSIPFFPVD